MSVFARFKRDPDGFRKLVELWETTPILRRQKMIDIGMAEDPVYAEKVLKYIMTFEDVVQLPDVELAELMAVAPARITSYAISMSGEEVQKRFLRNAVGAKASELRDFLEVSGHGLREIGGAQLKLIEIARALERRGLIKTKHIPLNV